jgi:phosphatidylglycerol:prolipoprotein diacylglycerol transferase
MPESAASPVGACYQQDVFQIPTSPGLHYAGDLAAWLAAFSGGRLVYRRRPASVDRLARQTAPSYFVSLALGGALGAWLLGSLNTLRVVRPVLSHSIAGAIAGAIVAVEIWKWLRGVKESTGGPFVIPLCLGIVVGRWGCLFAGLGDQTYGVPTAVPWGVDLGDGVARQPVQIYESASMALFLVFYWHALVGGRSWALRHGFHLFVLAYATQRFAWEFLKPYPRLIGPLNVFHLVMIGLGAYALIWIDRERRSPIVA